MALFRPETKPLKERNLAFAPPGFRSSGLYNRAVWGGSIMACLPRSRTTTDG